MTDGILLPGWDCPNSTCGVFNGTVKEDLKVCRCCATPRPSDLDLAFKRLQKTHEQALSNLTSVQERCTELVMENRRLRGQAHERILEILHHHMYEEFKLLRTPVNEIGNLADRIVSALEKP
jgi:hypothetical protein